MPNAGITVTTDVADGTCQAEVGLWRGIHALITPSQSIAEATGCSWPATVTLTSTCRCHHTRRKRLCDNHGQLNPADAQWFCGPCARDGHDCPVTPVIVTENSQEASNG